MRLRHTLDVILAAPPATTAVMTICGYTVSDVVQLVMLVYGLGLLLQQGYRLQRWWRKWRMKRQRRKRIRAAGAA